ncbi:MULTISPECIES: SIS domain-containing protein [Kitasatospora]|uniref:Fructoselysine-6-P-deglycase FrlB-like protein n=2 Tax=Kitasatospora TaxID=2063 RepID=A0ABT1IPP2_9ACTN|nr:sugar isomerase [Kitasatospora paracochleata]MCP2307065.1 fructoselysine-6-P-deglycase FrlB-like protein [Kitasatospora paracochleata]
MPYPSLTGEEIATQPADWRTAAAQAGVSAADLPQRGERVAVVGCGTSWFMAQAYAALREAGGHGETDAFAASEFPYRRSYDRVLAISRSGTTTEVLRLLSEVKAPSTAITADISQPIAGVADHLVDLGFADERSVVQTRFATTVLALLRAHLEIEGALPAGVATVARAAADAERAVAWEVPAELVACEQFTFLGGGWTNGLAQEAGLKMREASLAWTEAYPAMEYRHGPISITAPGRAAWSFGEPPQGLAEDIAATGGLLVADSGDGGLDPLADLVRAQKLAVALAEHRGLDPDRPRNLTRSIILG